MRYSIIIPTLNEEKLLPLLLQQLTQDSLQQKYNFEIIVSDGGSSDNTIQIAKNYGCIIVEHNSNIKQTIAMGRNVGAFVAKGEIFIFLNGDIVVDNPKNFFKVIEEDFFYSKYVAMTCRVEIHPEEEILSDKLFHKFYNKYFHFINLLGLGMARGECQIIRNTIFKQVDGNKEDLIAGEDFELFTRIRKVGKVLFSNKICIYESPRRYRKLGYWGVTWLWLKNSSSVYFRRKSLSRIWEEVR
jgi:glycosyltransferase involved in cell wall biosynthesis